MPWKYTGVKSAFTSDTNNSYIKHRFTMIMHYSLPEILEEVQYTKNMQNITEEMQKNIKPDLHP